MMQTKLFCGTKLTAEIQHQIGDHHSLIEVPYKGKRYLGVYLPSSISTQKIKEHSNLFLSSLQEACPEIHCTNLKLILFPQIFIG